MAHRSTHLQYWASSGVDPGRQSFCLLVILDGQRKLLASLVTLSLSLNVFLHRVALVGKTVYEHRVKCGFHGTRDGVLAGLADRRQSAWVLLLDEVVLAEHVEVRVEVFDLSREIMGRLAVHLKLEGLHEIHALANKRDFGLRFHRHGCCISLAGIARNNQRINDSACVV